MIVTEPNLRVIVLFVPDCNESTEDLTVSPSVLYRRSIDKSECMYTRRSSIKM